MPVNGEAPVPRERVSSVLRTGCTDPAVDSGDTVDAVVVGTGVAGYSAVIAARQHGAEDLPLEKASRSGVDCEKTAMAASWIGVARPSRISMAVGKRVASPFGKAYPTAGATLGPHLTNGHVIGCPVAAAESH